MQTGGKSSAMNSESKDHSSLKFGDKTSSFLRHEGGLQQIQEAQEKRFFNLESIYGLIT